MKAIKCKLIGNTRWGYCMTPQMCNSKSEAQKEGRFMVENGFWHSYRIVPTSNR